MANLVKNDPLDAIPDPFSTDRYSTIGEGIREFGVNKPSFSPGAHPYVCVQRLKCCSRTKRENDATDPYDAARPLNSLLESGENSRTCQTLDFIHRFTQMDTDENQKISVKICVHLWTNNDSPESSSLENH